MLWKGLLLATCVVGAFAFPSRNPNHDVSRFFVKMDDGSRIVGGDVAPQGSVPYIVALTTGSLLLSQFCAGSLITTNHVLTAAHCIDYAYGFFGLVSSLRVNVGSQTWNRGTTQYSVKSNITHPHWLDEEIKNDIGIFITKDKVVLTDAVQPVPLSFDIVGGGVDVRVNGWGLTRYPGVSGSMTLLELYTKTIDGAKCQSEVQKKGIELGWWVPDVEEHIELCTYLTSGKGNCHGDSGGPLIRTDNGNQIGVVSWGFPCAIGAPDMFARVSGFEEFITTGISSA